jgi:hypothetical protein
MSAAGRVRDDRFAALGRGAGTNAHGGGIDDSGAGSVQAPAAL